MEQASFITNFSSTSTTTDESCELLTPASYTAFEKAPIAPLFALIEDITDSAAIAALLFERYVMRYFAVFKGINILFDVFLNFNSTVSVLPSSHSTSSHPHLPSSKREPLSIYFTAIYGPFSGGTLGYFEDFLELFRKIDVLVIYFLVSTIIHI